MPLNCTFPKVTIKDFKSNVSNFWKYGISGDNPILLVKIKSIEDVYVIEECLAMYDYYRSKRIYIDFISIFFHFFIGKERMSPRV